MSKQCSSNSSLHWPLIVRKHSNKPPISSDNQDSKMWNSKKKNDSINWKKKSKWSDLQDLSAQNSTCSESRRVSTMQPMEKPGTSPPGFSHFMPTYHQPTSLVSLSFWAPGPHVVEHMQKDHPRNAWGLTFIHCLLYKLRNTQGLK